MNKEEYILSQFKQRYPELFKDLEMSYRIDATDKVLKEHHFKEFLEKLEKL